MSVISINASDTLAKAALIVNLGTFYLFVSARVTTHGVNVGSYRRPCGDQLVGARQAAGMGDEDSIGAVFHSRLPRCIAANRAL